MSPPDFPFLMARVLRGQRRTLRLACLASAVAAASAMLLLGLSGWFLAAAAAAGLAGPAAVLAFNTALPSAAIRLLAIARTGGRYAERLLSHTGALRALAGLRGGLFAALAGADPRAALAVAETTATARLVGDVAALENAVVRRTLPWAAAGAGLAGLCLLPAGWAPLAVFALAAALHRSCGAWLAHRLAARGATAQQQAGALREAVQAALAASAELRCYGMQHRALTAALAAEPALGAAQRDVWRADLALSLLGATLSAAAMALVLLVTRAEPLALRALAVLACGAGMEAMAAWGRAAEQDGAVNVALARLAALPGRAGPPAEPASGAITLHLAGENLPLVPGETLALTGISGAGKSRLLEILVGLRPAAPGLVDSGGADLALLPLGALRAHVAWQPQDAAVLAGSIAENLRLADAAAPEPALWAALEDAGLAARVRAMPEGLATPVGDGGLRLSGGERKRLALARALLRPAPILLLDEPTEGLDAATEALVLTRLAARLARTGQGALIVTHRPAAARLCRRAVALRPA